MFLRRYVRTKAGKKHTYFALVESFRSDAGPRQHVVAYLGELNADQERRWQRTVWLSQSPRRCPTTALVSRR